MRLILKNDFHNTSVRLDVRPKHGYLRLSEYQIKRAKKALCGVLGCTCSNTVGMRGPNDYEFFPEYTGGGILTINEKHLR
jgi:hypothetical protein